MSQELLRALNESRAYFQSAGMTADVEAIDEKIAAVEKIAAAEAKAAEPAEKPAAPKKTPAKAKEKK